MRIKRKDVYGTNSFQICSKIYKEIQKRKKKEWTEHFTQVESTTNQLQQQVPIMV